MSFRGTSWPWLILLSSWFWMDDFNGPWYLIRINNLKSFSRMFRRFGAAVAGPCQFLLSFFLSFFPSFCGSFDSKSTLSCSTLFVFEKYFFVFFCGAFVESTAEDPLEPLTVRSSSPGHPPSLFMKDSNNKRPSTCYANNTPTISIVKHMCGVFRLVLFIR